jgi:hypothetical protein
MATAANQYCFALFYSTTATTVEGTANAQMPDVDNFGFGLGVYAFEDSNWTFAAYGTNSTFAAGRFLSAAQNADGTTTVFGLPANASAQFVVLGWSVSLGSSLTELEAALATGGYGWLGESAVSGPILLGDGVGIPVSDIFGTSSPRIPGFTLGVIPLVPEPSTFALAAVGLVGCFFCRQRKSV